jgi:hypothetical protein
LGWGTVNAKTVTLSFQVYSSLTGTFSGALRNSTDARSYPFTYTVSSANTWTTINVTIAGDTTGTWVTNNGTGIKVVWNLGCGSTYLASSGGSWQSANYYGVTGSVSVVGTNGATFYITGVQLEVGSSATGFEYRQYQQELALCYRYYRRYTGSNGAYTALGIGVTASSTSISRWGFMLDIPMRATPSIGFTNCVGWNTTLGGTATAGTNYSSTNYIDTDITTSGILSTAGLAAKILTSGTTGYIELNGAEL